MVKRKTKPSAGASKKKPSKRPPPPSSSDDGDDDDVNEGGSFETELHQLFGSRNLYDVLKLDPALKQKHSSSVVKKAYYKASLDYHPDRLASDADAAARELATKKFQSLSRVYAVLSDEEKRKVYDETGVIDDENILSDGDGQDWLSYWRLLFKKVTKADLESFDAKYKGSDEERDALASAYTQHDGCMTQILQTVMCATNDDEPRFRRILTDMIADGRLAALSAFTDETSAKRQARQNRARKEAKAADKALQAMQAKENDASTSLSLVDAIRAKQNGRQSQAESFLDNLAAKYASPKAKAKKGRHT